MACSPTPTQTLYATTNSYSAITFVTSSFYTITPSAVVTSVTSSCVDSGSGNNARAPVVVEQVSGGGGVSLSTSASASASTSTSTSISASTTSAATSVSVSGGTSVDASGTISSNPVAARAPTRDESEREHALDSQPGTRMTHRRSARLGHDRRAFGISKFGGSDVGSGGTGSDSSSGTCQSYTTITSLSTSFGQPTTTWSAYSTTSNSLVVATVPTQTLFGSCGPTGSTGSTAMSSSGKVSTSGAPTGSASGSASSVVSSSSGLATAAFEQSVGTTSLWSMSAPSSTAPASSDSASAAGAAIVSSATSSVVQVSSPATSSLPSILPASTSSPLILSTAAVPTSTSSSNATATTSSDTTSHTTSRGVQAGAVIGGLVGLVALIALILFAVRTWKVYRQKKRTEVLRSSWFYGGDVAEPEEPEQEEQEKPTLISRFSAPSFSTRRSHRVSRSAATFLANPLSHLRQRHSGRFPTLGTFTGMVRNSFMPRYSGHQAYPSDTTAASIGAGTLGETPFVNNAGVGVGGTGIGTRTGTPTTAGMGGWATRFFHRDTSPEGEIATGQLFSPKPNLVDGQGSEHSHQAEVGWGQSYASVRSGSAGSRRPASGSPYSVNPNLPPDLRNMDANRGGIRPDPGQREEPAPRLTYTAPTDSPFYSADGSAPGFMPHDPTAPPVAHQLDFSSPPSHPHPWAASQSSPVGDLLSFPLPPPLPVFIPSPRSRGSALTSPGGSSSRRNLLPPRPGITVAHSQAPSTLFEYSAFDEGPGPPSHQRYSLATSESHYSQPDRPGAGATGGTGFADAAAERATRDWYDKPLWDREHVGLSRGKSAASGKSGVSGVSRVSRKSAVSAVSAVSGTLGQDGINRGSGTWTEMGNDTGTGYSVYGGMRAQSVAAGSGRSAKSVKSVRWESWDDTDEPEPRAL